MPEIVEVCLTAQFLKHKFLNKKFVGIKLLGGRYTRNKMSGLDEFNIFNNNHKNNFIIKNIDSKGKFLWFELSDQENSCFILNRFGLQGEWGLTKRLHSNILFQIENPKNNKKYDLYFTDPRNFGTINISFTQADLQDELNNLGPDFLKQDFTDQDFDDRIKNYMTTKSRGNKEIIKILMDQNKNTGLGSGLGNYLSVEILYHAKISPYKKIKDIYADKNLVNQLAYSIKYVLKLSYETAEIGYLEHLDPEVEKYIKKIRLSKQFEYHKDIHLKKDDIFVFQVYRQTEDPLGNPIDGSKIINGRTTYWCPTIQK